MSKAPAPPSAGSSLTDMSTPSRSRRVFLYSRRLRRRIVICPWASPMVLRAVTSVPDSISRKSAFATGVGCLESSGGISPELTWFRIFCQRSASWTVSSFRAISSRRSFPFCLSALWHSTQYSLRKARCFSSMRASGVAPKAGATRMGRRIRRRRGMSDKFTMIARPWGSQPDLMGGVINSARLSPSLQGFLVAVAPREVLGARLRPYPSCRTPVLSPNWSRFTPMRSIRAR